MLDKNVDIFLISETKLDDSFLSALEGSTTPCSMVETIKEVVFYCMLGTTLHHVYCNVNHNVV